MTRRSKPKKDRALRIGLLIFVALASPGCDTTLHQSLAGGPDAPPSPACLEARDHADFAWIRDNILAKSCSAFTTCHTGGNPPGHLDLSAAHAYANLVNVPEVTIPDHGVRVAPGDPDNSYLLVKLGLVEGPVGDAGTAMPPNSPPLCPEKLDAVRRWIEAGAPNDEVPDAPFGTPDSRSNAE